MPLPARAPAFPWVQRACFSAEVGASELLAPRNQSFPGTPTQVRVHPLHRGSGWTGGGARAECPQAGSEANSSRGAWTHASCVLTSCPPPLHTLWSFRMRKGQKTLPLAWHPALAQHRPPHHVASRPRCQQSKGNDTKCIGNIFISKSIEGALKPYSILEVTFASRTDNKYAHPPALGLASVPTGEGG